MREIYEPKWQIAEPHVSPDGKSVALIEGLMSDAGLTGGDVMIVPMAGGAARNLTAGMKASPSSQVSISKSVIFPKVKPPTTTSLRTSKPW